MGVVMYQLLQGRPPFQGESYAELVLKVGADPPNPIHVPLPPGLGEVILKCLEKDPKARHQNVAELARSLAPFSSDPVTASQLASRTARILQHQSGAGGVQSLPIAAGGGLATPVPLSPAQLTPRSWPPSTSQSLGKGQQTMPVRGSRGWLIAGACSLAVLAAAGGYLASELRQDRSEPAASDTATVQMPAPTPKPAAAPTTAPAETSPAPPPAKTETPAVTDEVPADSHWKPQTVQPTIVPKTETPKPDAKTETKATAKTETKAAAKTEPAAPAKTEPKATAKTETKAAAKTAAPAKTETKAPAAKTAAKTAPAKAETKSPVKAPAKTTAKTPAKTPTKPAKTTTPKKTDLFDTRK
jgi:serine/threonine protein kinase